MEYIGFTVLAVLVAALKLGLILAGVLPPISSNSAGNLVFSLLQIAVIACMGWKFAKQGLKKVAVKGAVLMLAYVAVLCMAVLIGFYLKRPVLGAQVPSTYYLLVILTLNAAFNILVGAVIATCAAWIARKIKKPADRGVVNVPLL